MADSYTLPLSGKVAVVTGGSRSIGEGIAIELAKRGASVVITYASAGSEAHVKEICTRIEAFPHKPSAHSIRVDLSVPSAPEVVTSSLVAWRGKDLSIDILVNNAGGGDPKSLKDVTIEDYDSIFNLNVRGVVFLTQALLPYINQNGRIINIGSVGARSPFKNLSLYSASKAALEGLTRCWAAELGHKGTTVNCVSPGPVMSPLLEKMPQNLVEMQKARTPIGNRMGTIEEIAHIVAFLASQDSSWITGQTINASGGYSVY
ncbi:3-ketoacyl-acyl carrier protein reductase [Xylaria nigripes]|nr:3-ketoacyl-acyl carrier protein reductase [Xylaria nigripes]